MPRSGAHSTVNTRMSFHGMGFPSCFSRSSAGSVADIVVVVVVAFSFLNAQYFFDGGDEGSQECIRYVAFARTLG